MNLLNCVDLPATYPESFIFAIIYSNLVEPAFQSETSCQKFNYCRAYAPKNESPNITDHPLGRKVLIQPYLLQRHYISNYIVT